MEKNLIKPNQRREIFGWMLYDWANSAFYTTVISVMLGPYLISLAESSVGKEGVIFDLGLFRVTTGGFPAFCLAISVVSMSRISRTNHFPTRWKFTTARSSPVITIAARSSRTNASSPMNKLKF